jgi:hypothetical protein
MTTSPKRWNTDQLQQDAGTARALFRHERLEEPLDLYNEFFAKFATLFDNLVDKLPALAADPIDAALVADLVDGRDAQKAFRYLTAPPISADDLMTMADATLTASRLRLDVESAKRVRDTVLTVIDPHRFPWVGEMREPTHQERTAAVVSSAALAAAREVETSRRNTAKEGQEQSVKRLLASVGMTEVKSRDIPMLTEAPAPGEFCGESRLAGTRADVVARLADGRVMAVECKVSNSAVNSYKRIVHDTGGKAATWYAQLGRAQVVPAAVLSGVFSAANLADVQDNKGVGLFWQHRLSDLADFVTKAK